MALPIGLQRLAAGAAIAPAVLALPITAAALDQRINENLLVPAAAGGAIGLGAAVGAALPAAFTATGSRGRAAMIGGSAALGVAALGTAALMFALGGP
jgi:hypothetical protein